MFKHRLKFQCAKKRCKSGLMDHFQKNISWKVFYIWSLWTIILSKLSGGGGVVARNCSAPTFSAHVKLHVYASIEGNFNASLKHYHCCWHSWSSSPPWKKQMSRVICVLSIVFEILPCLHKSNSLQWKYRLRLIINHQQADCASLHLQTQTRFCTLWMSYWWAGRVQIAVWSDLGWMICFWMRHHVDTVCPERQWNSHLNLSTSLMVLDPVVPDSSRSITETEIRSQPVYTHQLHQQVCLWCKSTGRTTTQESPQLTRTFSVTVPIFHPKLTACSVYTWDICIIEEHLLLLQQVE